MEKNEVLDASVLIVGASGLTTIFGVIEHPPAIDRCLVLFPEKADFYRGFELAQKLRLNGTPIGCVDIMVAGMCLNRDFRLLTKDSDFNHVKEVEKEFDFHLIK